MALVAAGIEPLIEIRLQQLSAAAVAEALDAVSDRVSLVERTVLNLTATTQPAEDYVLDADTIVAVEVDPTDQRNRLRHRVFAPMTASLDGEIDKAIGIED